MGFKGSRKSTPFAAQMAAEAAAKQDIMLPKIDGITLLKWLRNQKKTTPVLLLTAKSSIEERVNGLDSGADDYLIKPFAFEELQARLRVLLRRNITADPSDILIYEDLVMDTKKKKVSRNGKEISLTTKEYKLLQYMMRNPGHVLSRDQLEQRGWDSTFEGGSNIIDVYIRYLRKKIDSDYEKKLIHTVTLVFSLILALVFFYIYFLSKSYSIHDLQEELKDESADMLENLYDKSNRNDILYNADWTKFYDDNVSISLYDKNSSFINGVLPEHFLIKFHLSTIRYDR